MVHWFIVTIQACRNILTYQVVWFCISVAQPRFPQYGRHYVPTEMLQSKQQIFHQDRSWRWIVLCELIKRLDQKLKNIFPPFFWSRKPGGSRSPPQLRMQHSQLQLWQKNVLVSLTSDLTGSPDWLETVSFHAPNKEKPQNSCCSSSSDLWQHLSSHTPLSWSSVLHSYLLLLPDTLLWCSQVSHSGSCVSAAASVLPRRTALSWGFNRFGFIL